MLYPVLQHRDLSLLERNGYSDVVARKGRGLNSWNSAASLEEVRKRDRLLDFRFVSFGNGARHIYH